MNDARGPLSKGARPRQPQADLVAVEALAFIAAEPERAAAFLAATGCPPEGLRQAARDPAFLLGVLDHLMNDEALLLAFAAHAGLTPEAVVRAHHDIAGPMPSF